MAKLINRRIQVVSFPIWLKTATVIPLHKDGNFDNPSNYQRISLLSSLRKVFEKVYSKKVVEFLKKHQLFSMNSSDFGQNAHARTLSHQLQN